MEISPNAANLLLLMALCTHPFRAILAYLLPQYAILNDAQRGTPNSIMYMAFQKGTQTAPHGGVMPPQAGISTAGNGNS